MRFRLKTDFLTYARDQVRGGLWYKPSWWDAVHRVPPPSPPGRMRKKDIPRIRFAEDRLVSEFNARNPDLRRFDERNVASRRASDTLVSQFVSRQLGHMRADVSQEAAYARAQAWLVESGREALVRANPSLRNVGKVDQRLLPPVGIFQRVAADQVALVSEVIVRAAATATGRGGGASTGTSARRPRGGN